MWNLLFDYHQGSPTLFVFVKNWSTAVQWSLPSEYSQSMSLYRTHCSASSRIEWRFILSATQWVQLSDFGIKTHSKSRKGPEFEIIPSCAEKGLLIRHQLVQEWYHRYSLHTAQCMLWIEKKPNEGMARAIRSLSLSSLPIAIMLHSEPYGHSTEGWILSLTQTD